MFTMSIRLLLLRERLQKKIKACRVAKHIGITPVALSRFENGHTDLKSEHVEKYANYIGYDLMMIAKPVEDKRTPIVKATEIISKAYGIPLQDAHDRLVVLLKK